MSDDQGRDPAGSADSALLPAITLETGPAPQATVIWLHGLGADGWDFVPLVRELALPDRLALRFLFPHAPPRPVTINGGAVMRAWYDISLQGLARQPDAAGIRQSARQVEALIAAERARGMPARRIVLAGFSQGGVIALHAALRHGEPLLGVLALSTYLGLPDTLEAEALPVNRRCPIFMAHGSQDNVVPLTLAERSRDRLLAAGYAVQWHTYRMAHSVAAEEIQAISAHLQALLAGP